MRENEGRLTDFLAPIRTYHRGICKCALFFKNKEE
jgi:hypothetical protein